MHFYYKYLCIITCISLFSTYTIHWNRQLKFIIHLPKTVYSNSAKWYNTNCRMLVKYKHCVYGSVIKSLYVILIKALVSDWEIIAHIQKTDYIKLVNKSVSVFSKDQINRKCEHSLYLLLRITHILILMMFIFIT